MMQLTAMTTMFLASCFAAWVIFVPFLYFLDRKRRVLDGLINDFNNPKPDYRYAILYNSDSGQNMAIFDIEKKVPGGLEARNLWAYVAIQIGRFNAVKNIDILEKIPLGTKSGMKLDPDYNYAGVIKAQKDANKTELERRLAA